MARARASRRAAQPARSSRTAARRISRPRRAGRSARSASPARSASTRPRISARSATAARSSPTIGALAERIRRLRNGGQTDRYHHEEPGVNSRLDEMQAAILRARLPFLPAGRRAAGRSPRTYRSALAGRAGEPLPPSAIAGHVYHLFVVRTRRRATRCRQHLAAQRHRNADSLPGADSAPAGAGRQRTRRTVRVAAARVRRGAVAAAPSGACATTTLAEVAAAVHAVGDVFTKGLTRVRALITGGAGFIGSHLSEALLEHGHEVLDPRQPVDRLDRQHRASQGAARLRVLHRHGGQRAAAGRAHRSQRRRLSSRRRGRRQADRRAAGATRSRPTCTAPKSC